MFQVGYFVRFPFFFLTYVISFQKEYNYFRTNYFVIFLSLFLYSVRYFKMKNYALSDFNFTNVMIFSGILLVSNYHQINLSYSKASFVPHQSPARFIMKKLSLSNSGSAYHFRGWVAFRKYSNWLFYAQGYSQNIEKNILWMKHCMFRFYKRHF